MNISDAFREQARACEKLGSPFMARLMTLLADRLTPGTAVTDVIFNWPGDPLPRADSVPLRLAGALHALRLQKIALTDAYPPNDIGDDALWSAVEITLNEQSDHVLGWLKSPPQTNEVRRAAAILPALALLHARYSRPVALFELGASGGLNLRADRFRLDLPGLTLGPPDAEVTIRPEWSGPLPHSTLPKIVHRAGVDINPLDPTDPDGQLRLIAYLWPDQPERIARTKAAIREASRTPAILTKGDAGDWLETTLTVPLPGTMRVVFHTIAWQYFPDSTRSAANAAIERAARQATPDAPFVHFSFEGDGGKSALISMTAWPGGAPEVLGHADFHGRWIDWRTG